MRSAGVVIMVLVAGWAVSGCQSPVDPDPANVVHFEGPTYEEAGTGFSYGGTVKNVGGMTAEGVIIHVLIPPARYDSDGPVIVAFLAAESVSPADSSLDPGEASPWKITFYDGDRRLRDRMDPAKTRCEIWWEGK